MRMLNLTFRNTIDFLINQRRIFIILIISLVTASYSSLYLFSLYTYVHNSTLSQSNNGKTYIVEFKEHEEIKNKHNVLYHILSMDEIPKIKEISLHNQLKDEQEDVSIVGISVEYLYLNLLEGRKFTDDDIINGKNITIISANLRNNYNNNESNDSIITIFDNKCEIVGINSSYANEIYIPYSTYIMNDYNITNTRIVFEKELNSQQRKLLESEVKSIMASINIIDPVNQISEQYVYLMFVLFLISILLFFCMINVISLFKFWIEENKYRLMIYKICGANNIQIYYLIMMEALILGLLGFIISIGLFNFTIPYLKRFNVWYELGFQQKALILLIYLSSIYISIFKTGKRVSKTNPVEKSLWG